MLYVLDSFAQVLNPQEGIQSRYTPHVDMPSFIMDEQARIEYIADHYWDDFNFNDTTLIHNVDYTEQGYVDFIAFIRYMPMPVAQQAMSAMMTKAAANKTTFDYFAKISELYLYEPQSPYKNDELYIPVLRHIVSSNLLDEMGEDASPLSLEFGIEEPPWRTCH
jgi:hypothetical protein